jgi:hypothetical protein
VFVNNYFVYGPKGSNPWFQVDKNQSIYASGNMIDTDRDGKLNGGPSSIYYYQGVGEELSKPWSELTTSGPMLSAASAWRYVTSQSGVLPYDDIDSLIWHQVGTLGKEGALVEKSAEADSSTTRLADKYHLRAEAVTVGVFDMNGHYVGVTTQGLPQGRYMVRQKVNGRIVNKLVRKD